MSDFQFLTDELGQAFCREVAGAMVLFFGITEADAVERINQHWRHTAFTGDHIAYHETPDHWAKWIFYGKDDWKRFDHAAEAGLSRLERKINFLLDHLGLDDTIDDSISDNVRLLIGQGKVLEAVRLHRDETSLDLKESARVVERVVYQMTGARRP